MTETRILVSCANSPRSRAEKLTYRRIRTISLGSAKRLPETFGAATPWGLLRLIFQVRSRESRDRYVLWQRIRRQEKSWRYVPATNISRMTIHGRERNLHRNDWFV